MKLSIASAIIASVTALLLFQGCNETTPADHPIGAAPRPRTEWTLFRRDPNMTGDTDETLALPLKLAWTYETGQSVKATAVIADGKVFVGSFDGFFYCLDLESGEKIWSFETPLGVEGAACLVGDLVYFGDADGFVHALNRDTGKPAWKFETQGAIVGGMNYYVTPEGGTIVLVGSDDYHLYGIDAESGEQVLKIETGNYIKGAPSVDAESGVVIFGGCDELLRLVDLNTGDLVKEIEIGAYMANSSPVRDQIAYVAHHGGAIVAIDLKTGEKAWEYDADGAEFVGSPAVSQDRVYAGGPDKILRCLDRATGDELWQFSSRRGIDSSPVVTPDMIFCGSDDGRLYAIHPEDGAELWSYDIGARLNSSPAIAEGYLVICGQDNNIYAFQTSQ